MIPIVLEAPAGVTLSEGQTERSARLLVVGEYPKKNLTVTEADLDALVAHFSEPVPVKVEHQDTPLDPLGMVQRIWREGEALMGQVTFPASLGAFLRERGAAKLSVGLLKEPMWKLLEASLTLTPHVPTATLLSDGERAELVQLRHQVRAQSVDAQVRDLKAQGRVIPATEALARALLGCEAQTRVTLSDGHVSVSVPTAFRDFLQAQPPLVRLGETATVLSAGASGAVAGASADDEDADAGFTEDEQALLARLDVTPAAVRAMMGKAGGK